MKKVGITATFALLLTLFSCTIGLNQPLGIVSQDEGLLNSRSLAAVPAADAVEGRYIILFKAKPGNADRDMVRGNGAEIVREFSIVHAMAIRVPNERALAGLMHNPNVELIEPDYIRYALGETVPWGVTAVNAPQVWATTTGDNVKVAVLDTGIDYNHPDLAANYRGGYDFVNSDNDPFDGNGHGTHCAGTIGAITNNNIGVASVAYNVDLYAVKVLSDEGSGSTSNILAGVDWAVQNGMHIASMSLGGGRFSKTEEKAYQNAFNAGLLIICATGNDSATSISYPAGYASTMAIGAVDSALAIADFSNQGTGIHLVAPGVDVLSTVPVGTGQAADVVYGQQTLAAYALEFAPFVTNLTKPAVNCGMGLSAADFPATVAGNIALIQRGEISFADKVTNAQNAGAVGVILYNNESGIFSGTLGTAGTWIPGVTISLEDGQLLVAAGSPVVSLNILATNYDSFNGTSMATPHVSAVAALVKGANPDLSNQQIWDILVNSAHDLGIVGYDTTFGYGLVDAAAAVAAMGGGGDPEPVLVTEIFAGTLNASTSASSSFVVSGGTISATLSKTVRNATLSMALYNPAGSQVATGTTSLSYNAETVAGTWTIVVSNTGRRASGYTLTVTHEL